MTDQVLLLGLPGSGRRKFKQQFDQLTSPLQEKSYMILTPSELQSEQAQVWCLVDIRSDLSDETMVEKLLHFLQFSSVVIFNFMESTDLDMQMHWQQWLKDRAPGKTVYRFFNQNLPENWAWQTLGQQILTEVLQTSLQPIVMNTLAYKVDSIHLEHFLMGVDAARHNLQMPIYRVKAEVMTMEYENPVSIEVTPSRVDTFASEKASGLIEIHGQNLDEAWLNQLIDACQH